MLCALLLGGSSGSTSALPGRAPTPFPPPEQPEPKRQQRDHPAYPEAIRQAGAEALQLVAQGKLEPAIPLWTTLWRWQHQHLGPDDGRTLRTLRNLAALQLAVGRAAEAARSYGTLRQQLLRSQGPDSLDTLQACLDLARAWRSETRFEAAEQLTLQTLARLQALPSAATATGRLRLAEAQELLGTIAHEQGRYEAAAAAYRQALEQRLRLEGEGGTAIAALWGNLAQALLRLGQTVEALELQQRALHLYERSGGDQRQPQSTLLANIALSQSLLGQRQASLATLKRALVLRTALLGLDHPETARLLLNLAALELERGEPERAVAPTRTALAALQKHLGATHLSTAFALERLADLARSLNQPAEARRWSQASLAIREAQLPADHPDLATTRLGLGLADLALGDQAQGEAHLGQAVAIRRRRFGAEHPATAMAELLLGLALWPGPQQQRAADSLVRAIEAYDQVLGRQAPLLPPSERRRLVATLAESRNALYSLVGQGSRGRDLAFQARLLLHGRLEEIERHQSLIQRRHPQIQSLRRALELLSQQQLQEQPGRAPWQRLERQRQQLEQQLASLQRDQPRTAPVSVAQIRRALPPTAALVELMQYQPVRFRQGRLQASGEPRLAALILGGEGELWQRDLGPVAPINQAIWQALAATQRGALDQEQAWVRVGDRLIRPLLPQLHRYRIWYLSPDAELHRVPFAALAYPDAGGLRRYGEEHSIRLITTARELLERAPEERQPRSLGAALVVADPDFNAPPAGPAAAEQVEGEAGLPEAWRQFRWSRLPGSRAEGESLARLLGGQLVMQSGASSRVITSARSPRLLHVASHGAFLPTPGSQERGDRERQLALEGQDNRWQDPMRRAVLLFTGANRRDPREQEAGYLTARQAAMLQLEGTQLVTLSACESGKGRIELGEGVYGMRRALSVAGAHYTLLSLWKVNDQATRALMERLYHELQQGASPEQALLAAQQAMRHHPRREWRQPYVWAAFQLYGRGR